jgi:hypothetical protein
MNKEQLTTLSLNIDRLFYRLFEHLTEQEKVMLQATLESIRQILKGDF